MLKKVYLFLRRHDIGVVRTLYLLPFIAVILQNKWFMYILLYVCMSVCLLLEVGRKKEWREEDE